MLSIEIVQATKRGLTREPTECDKGSTSAVRGHPQTRSHTRWMNAVMSHNLVHIPHLRAIDEKSLFACDATVDLEAPVGASGCSSRGVTESPRRVRGSCQLASRAVWSTTRLSESNTSAVELRSGLSCPQMLLLQREREREKFPTLMQVLTCCSSEQVTWDVGATSWLADQVNFRVSRVLHTAHTTESRNSVQPPNLPLFVIDNCIPRFCCCP